MSNEKNVVVASAANRKAYNAAKAAEAKGYGAFIAAIQKLAPACASALSKERISVAEFAAYVGDDLSVGKDVSVEDKAERNRIRARIRYALDEAGMLEEKARSPQQGKKGKGKTQKSKGQAAAEAVETASEVSETNPRDRFSAVCSILRAMGRSELQRVANEVATLLAQASAETQEQAETTAQPVKGKAKRKAA